MCVHILSLSAQAQNIEQNCNESRKRYLEDNPDVAGAGMDPWSHYSIYGKREGRKWHNCNESISNSTISNNNLQVNSKIKFQKFDDFLNFFKNVNSSNVEFNGSTSNPPNPTESIYKRDYYNNQLIYEGYYKEIIKQNYGSTTYKETIKHGEGKTYMTNTDGYIEGYYVNGKLNGYGVHRSPSIGHTYKGYFVNNQKQGIGVVVNDGLQGTTKYFYEGNFLNNNYDGKGTIIYDFMAFIGDFKNGEMVNGTAYYPNNQMYKGEFLNENFHGKGEYYFSDGSKYIGEFLNGNYHGFGELYPPDGIKKGGLWEAGRLIKTNQDIENEKQRKIEEEKRLAEQERIEEERKKQEQITKSKNTVKFCSYKVGGRKIQWKYIDNRKKCKYCGAYLAYRKRSSSDLESNKKNASVHIVYSDLVKHWVSSKNHDPLLIEKEEEAYNKWKNNLGLNILESMMGSYFTGVTSAFDLVSQFTSISPSKMLENIDLYDVGEGNFCHPEHEDFYYRKKIEGTKIFKSKKY